jgi:hypothetical protein
MKDVQVRSASNAGLTYTLKVDATGKALACNCPSHTYRSKLGPCKHMVAYNTQTTLYEVYCYHCGTLAKGLTQTQASDILGASRTCPSCGDHAFRYRDHSVNGLVSA